MLRINPSVAPAVVNVSESAKQEIIKTDNYVLTSGWQSKLVRRIIRLESYENWNYISKYYIPLHIYVFFKILPIFDLDVFFFLSENIILVFCYVHSLPFSFYVKLQFLAGLLIQCFKSSDSASSYIKTIPCYNITNDFVIFRMNPWFMIGWNAMTCYSFPDYYHLWWLYSFALPCTGIK